MNEYVPLVKHLLVERHAHIFDDLDVVMLDDFAWIILDSNGSAVQVLDHEVDSGESLEQGDLLLHHQVSSLPYEILVRNQLHLHYNITWLSIGHLVSLSVNSILFSMGRSLVDFHLQLLRLFLYLLAIASLALFRRVDRLALAATLVTWACSLCIHARSQLHHDSPHSLSFTALAQNHSLSIRPSNSIALHTNSVSLNFEFLLTAIIKVFQSHLHHLPQWLHYFLLWTSSLLATSHSEQVEDVVEALGLSSTAQTLFSVFVISLSLFWIAENFIGNSDVLELNFGY